MLRRDFLKTASLLSVSPFVPGFVSRTAQAAENGKDTILVIIEMTGGNDGLNTVVPYTDDQYYKARPSIGIPKTQAVRFNDDLGLNPGMRNWQQLIERKEVSIVQGIGYPNPDRSHFESMDRWQAGEVTAKVSGTGWLAKSVPGLLNASEGSIPVMHIGSEKLPLACRGTIQGVFTVNQELPFELKLGIPGSKQEKARKDLLAEVAATDSKIDNELLPFVQRRHLQTYSSLETLQKVLKETNLPQANNGMAQSNLNQKIDLIGKLIERGFGTRIFYVAIDGFDTHTNQTAGHQGLLQQIADSVFGLFARLRANGDDKRVLVMTFSEFGRRVHENGSRGTDHGSGSSLFVVGPGVKGTAVGKHPSLKDLDDGDLKFHTDFRRLYATLLDQWLKCDSQIVLGQKFEHLDLLKART
jgi:uncharacterized protein (DUF1501 family)